MSIDRSNILTADTIGIKHAVDVLRNGGLVGLPTETVYGLAARAADPTAVARIFATKGRPADHPVIVHIGDIEQVSDWAVEVPDFAHTLMALWPGPLTLVLRKRSDVSPALTGGQDTIGLRLPSHPVALAVLRGLGEAIAAPSANRFGEVSPTTAEHVFQGLAESLNDGDVILDGGPCSVGVESTIVDCTSSQPRILRPGAISAETIAAVAGVDARADSVDAPRVSGSLESHYAPSAKVVLVNTADEVQATADTYCVTHAINHSRIGVMGVDLTHISATTGQPPLVPLLDASDADTYAQGLYSALRAADAQELSAVIAVLPPTDGIGIAIRDRLMRAAAGR
mgnify:CR=1 FL=1